MSETKRFSADTVEKALQQGLRQLGLTEQEVVVEVISEGKKGVFGFGKKLAMVDLTPKEIEVVEETTTTEVNTEIVTEDTAPTQESAVAEDELSEKQQQINEAIRVTTDYLTELATVYGAPAAVSATYRRDEILFTMTSEKQGLLIGKHGKILNALQVLAQTMVHQYVNSRMTVALDIGDYRIRRSEKLKVIAERTESRVMRTKRPVFLEPLPAYERKQIHALLSKNPKITTHSEGNEPHRYLVVEYKG